MSGTLQRDSGFHTEPGTNASGLPAHADVALRADLEEAARSGDVKGVLSRLNARTRYRFTGLYRVEEPVLRNICLFDRENPSLTVSGAVSTLEDTYCAIAYATDCGFATADSRNDDRLGCHTARLQIISYAGVRVTLGSGVAGTLCHFDFRPRLLSNGEIPFLQSVSPLLAEFLATPTPA